MFEEQRQYSVSPVANTVDRIHIVLRGLLLGNIQGDAVPVKDPHFTLAHLVSTSISILICRRLRDCLRRRSFAYISILAGVSKGQIWREHYTMLSRHFRNSRFASFKSVENFYDVF